jgi:hypothetical protein
MAQPGFIFGGNTGMSYDQIQKQRDIANELLRANMNTPQNVGEGLSAIGRALAAKAIDKRVSRADEDNRKASEQRRAGVFGSIFGGVPTGGASSAPAPFSPAPAAGPGASVADDTMAALGKTPMRPFRDAIASIESAGSGDYAAVGPTNPRLGRALGRYQIMEANIGPWSREVLGREVTPEEFMANPQIQDAIFDGKFGKYVEQFGPEGAAQAWFAGPGGVGKMGRQDVLGTSVADYTQKFTAALGGSPQMQPAPAGNMSMGNPGTIQAIADLLADPYTPPGEKAMLEQAMAMQLQGMDPMRQIEMQKAQLELQQMQQPQAPQPGFTMLTDEQEVQMGLNPAGVYQQGPDGALKVVQDAPPGSPRPMTAEERAAWGISPEDTTPYALVDGMPKAIGGGGVTVNNDLGGGKFDDEFAKGDAASLVAVSDAGNAAIRNLGRIDELDRLLAASPTGAGAALARAAGEFGVNTEGLDDIQAAQAIINSLVPEQRQPGSGPMSDADLALFKESLPRIINQPGGNQSIIQTMRAIAQYDAEGAQIVQRLRAGEIKRAEAFDLLQARKNPLEGFKAPAGAKTPEAAAIDFSNMTAAELADVDINSLTPEQMDAMLKRFDEVGQ